MVDVNTVVLPPSAADTRREDHRHLGRTGTTLLEPLASLPTDMSINSSSNHSLLHPDSSSDKSSIHQVVLCLTSRQNFGPFMAFNVANTLLLLPPCVFVLYLGVRRWLQQRSSSTAATISHSDSFTFHMVIIEMVGICGSIVSYCGIFLYSEYLIVAGLHFTYLNWFGEFFFHILTCVEHYLAVVHPLIYLGLRKQRGVRIRNITIGCVWLICIALTCLLMVERVLSIVNLCILVFSFIVILFCGVSVLCVLIRPGPGEQGGDRERVDQTKLRAFHTIMSVTGVLMLKLSVSLVWAVLYALKGRTDCEVVMCVLWFNLPSNLVLPVLFLHRSGKLGCFKSIIKRG